jgi:phosphoenolpyruvate carboxylase
VHADLFAASNRRLKQARFVVELRDGRPAVTSMVLVDDVQTGRETVVKMLAVKPRQLGDELFNPMALSRSDVAP